MIRKFQGFLAAQWYCLTSPAYRLVKKSPLFDPDYYLHRNSDVAALGMDPLVHYLTRGFVELRSPGPLFDRRYYLHQAPGLDEAVDNPLVHFLTQGRYRGLRPNFLVDPDYYALRAPESAASGLDPLAHFLQQAAGGMDRSPSPYFDPQFYCARYQDAAHLAHDPAAAYRHFFLFGLGEKRQPSAFFDTAWYLDKTPVLHEQGLDPISHYHLFGVKEGKSPSPLFDPGFYAAACETAGDEDPFAHYLRHEPKGGRRPCAWFDPDFYRREYLAETPQASPLKHYLQQGIQAQAYPSREVAELPIKPLVSVIVPVYNVVPAYLNSCIRSVLYQSYPHWQLCLADDCSTDPQIRPLLERWAGADSRIKVTWLPENRGISAATNAAEALADGEYLAFLDNDDELAPEALFAFVRAMGENGGDLFYSDEDLIGADGTRFSVFRKPGFNRELLLCHNYVTHCVVAERSLFARVGGCAGEANGAQDHDLFLKLSEQARKIVHLPEILYHWRASESSTSINHAQKEYANEAGQRSVAAALDRQGIAGAVQLTELKFFYRARRNLPEEHSVTVLVHWRRPIDKFRPWLSRLLAGAGLTVSQLAVAVESREWLDTVGEIGRAAGIATECLVVPAGTGTSTAWNGAIEGLRGEYVALADSCVESACDGWLASLLEYSQARNVGLVGGRVHYPVPPDEAEVTPIPDIGNASPTYYARFLANCSVLMNGLHCPQEVRSLSGELCLLRRDLLRQAGGFSDDFPSLFCVQDLAFRLHRQGRINIYTPYCASTIAVNVQSEPQTPAREKPRFQEQWGELLRQGDPFYNTGLLSDHGLDLAAFYCWLAGSSTDIPLPRSFHGPR